MPPLAASNDFFIRTSDEQHGLAVQKVLQRVHDNGHVFKGLYEGWYCPRCADFKVENEIAEGNRCPIHEIPLVRESEENWFFRLSTFQEPLERLYAEQPDFVLPRERRNEALAFIQSGLQDISLSRGKITWGVTVPWDPTHVFYVWFDALLNYYTALSYARPGEDLTDRFWPAQVHLIGKDILKFHTVFWPAMLLAADLPLPEHVFVHGFLLGGDGRKMSKSLGNVLDPFEVIDRFGVDALRFYLLRDVVLGGDGSVSIEGVAGALRERARQRLREPGQPHGRDAAPLPRRRRPGRASGPGPPGRLRRPVGSRRRARRRLRGLAGPRGDLAARAPAEPLRRGAGAVAAGQGPRRAPRTSTACCARWPRACASSPSCCTRGSR